MNKFSFFNIRKLNYFGIFIDGVFLLLIFLPSSSSFRKLISSNQPLRGYYSLFLTSKFDCELNPFFYFSCCCRWLKANRRKVWDSTPTCRGPGDLGGRLVEDMTFDDLCDGQWASMVRLTPRVPIKQSREMKTWGRTLTANTAVIVSIHRRYYEIRSF